MRSIIQRRVDYPFRGGRIESEWPAGMNRNRWPLWIGISGRNASEYATSTHLPSCVTIDSYRLWCQRIEDLAIVNAGIFLPVMTNTYCHRTHTAFPKATKSSETDLLTLPFMFISSSRANLNSSIPEGGRKVITMWALLSLKVIANLMTTQNTL